MRSSETWIAGTANELRDRFAVAIGRVPVSPLVLGHPKRIDLTVRHMLDPAAVGTKSKRVTRMHRDDVPIGARDLTLVVESVAGINPAVAPVTNRIDQAMCIASCIERAQDDITLVALSIAIGIAQVPNVWNAKAQASLAIGQDTDWNIQPVGKRTHFIRRTIAVRVSED